MERVKELEDALRGFIDAFEKDEGLLTDAYYNALSIIRKEKTGNEKQPDQGHQGQDDVGYGTSGSQSDA